MIRRITNILQFHRWRAVHGLSNGAIEGWQRKRLCDLVWHAYCNVPLYRFLWREFGSEPSVLFAAFSALPVITKKDFMVRPAEEYLDASRPIVWRWRRTSGTTGEPFRFLSAVFPLPEQYSDFSLYRFLTWRGIPFRRIRERMRIVRIKVRSLQTQNRLFIPVEELLRDPQDAVSRIKNFSADVIESYPSLLFEVGRVYAALGSARPLARFAVSYGENLSVPQRAFIEDTLRCEVYDRYGLEEFGALGVECRYHDGFHLNSESFVLEILDERGRSVSDGTRGRIVITDLFNFTMPFIRYDTGDFGVVAGRTCRCGLQGIRFKVEGRSAAFLEFGSKKVHHLEIDGVLDDFAGSVLQYQARKVSASTLVVDIVPFSVLGEDLAREIKQRISALVGPAVHIEVRSVGAVSRLPVGKCQIVRDEIAELWNAAEPMA